MMYNHEAIYRSHPNVKRIDDSFGVFDSDGNEVTLDQSLVDAAAAEIATQNAWSKLRHDRNQLLADTDYLALSDVTLSSEMTTYRQALRDLPANSTDPANPVWPTKPEA